MSTDYNGINLGVFALRNNPQSYKLISGMYAFKDKIDSGKYMWKDQTALSFYMKSHTVKMKKESAKKMNTYYRNNDGTKWKRGDWILHQVNCNSASCTDSFIKMSKIIKF